MFIALEHPVCSDPLKKRGKQSAWMLPTTRALFLSDGTRKEPGFPDFIVFGKERNCPEAAS